MKKIKMYSGLVAAIIFLISALIPVAALADDSNAAGVTRIALDVISAPSAAGDPATVKVTLTGELLPGQSVGWAVGPGQPSGPYTPLAVTDGTGTFTTEGLSITTIVWVRVIDESGNPALNGAGMNVDIVVPGAPSYTGTHITGIPQEGVVAGSKLDLGISPGATSPIPEDATYLWTADFADSGVFGSPTSATTTFAPSPDFSSILLKCTISSGGIVIAEPTGVIIRISADAPEISLTATPDVVKVGEEFELRVTSDADLTGAIYGWSIPEPYVSQHAIDMSSPVLTFVAEEEGTVTFFVDVVINDLRTATKSVTVTVKGSGPNGTFAIAGPSAISTGDTIDLSVSMSPDTLVGASGAISTTGLEFVSVSGSEYCTADSILLMNHAGRTAVYTYKVTAPPGQPASFQITNVTVSDGNMDGAGTGAMWSADVPGPSDRPNGSSMGGIGIGGGRPVHPNDVITLDVNATPNSLMSVRGNVSTRGLFFLGATPATTGSSATTFAANSNDGLSVRYTYLVTGAVGGTVSFTISDVVFTDSYGSFASQDIGYSWDAPVVAAASDIISPAPIQTIPPESTPIPIPILPTPIPTLPPASTPVPAPINPSVQPSANPSTSSSAAASASASPSESPEVSASESPAPDVSSSAAPSAAASAAASNEPVEIKPNAPQAPSDLEVTENPNGSGSILIGISIGASTGDSTKVSVVSAWISVPADGSVEIRTPDGDIVPPSSPIGTGMLISVLLDGNAVQSTVVVIRGDVTGSGIMNLTQLTRMASAYVGTNPLHGAFQTAADLNGDGRLSLTDLVLEASMYRRMEG